MALASTISVKNQNEKEFVELLNRALAVDVKEKYPGRLANVIAQRRARWLLTTGAIASLAQNDREGYTMRRWSMLIMGVIMAAALAPPARAVTVKLGSIAPRDGSPWDIAPEKIAAEWSRSAAPLISKFIPEGSPGTSRT